MSAIKPPTGPGGVATPPSADSATNAKRAGETPFQDRVQSATNTTAGAPTDPTQAVLGDLRAGRITPDQAVSQLTELALSHGVPTAMRSSVEARLRDFIAHDPTVQDLMKQMGATVPTDK